MTDTTKSRLSPEAESEQKADEVRPEESFHPGGKASTAPADQIEGCSEDTITDGDGSYLEPPD
jgi:hypothetical protein